MKILKKQKILLFYLVSFSTLIGIQNTLIGSQNTTKENEIYQKPAQKTQKKKKRKKSIEQLFKEINKDEKEISQNKNIKNKSHETLSKKLDEKSKFSSYGTHKKKTQKNKKATLTKNNYNWKALLPYVYYLGAFGIGYYAQQKKYGTVVIGLISIVSSYLEYSYTPESKQIRLMSASALSGLSTRYYFNRTPKPAQTIGQKNSNKTNLATSKSVDGMILKK